VGALARLRAMSTREPSGSDDVDATADEAFVHRFAGWHAAEPRRWFWIAEIGDAPVGMLNMLEFVRMPRPAQPESRWGYIANVFVLPAHRDAGIGRRLLTAAIGWAHARDYARVVLSPSPRSVPLYARLGFGPATSLMVLQVGPSEDRL
jgi:GNAT superfamily N-acetyltransferase